MNGKHKNQLNVGASCEEVKSLSLSYIVSEMGEEVSKKGYAIYINLIPNILLPSLSIICVCMCLYKS